ncbi:MAG TPA: ATP-dependent DNA helicase RecG [Candidatus Paceibacterota bacterium]
MDIDEPISNYFLRLTDSQKKALKKISLESVRDLLFYFPSRYETFGDRRNIANLKEGDKTTVFGKVIEKNIAKTFRKRMSISTATIGDVTGTIDAVWFHQPYIANMLQVGEKVALSGKVARNKSGLYIANPSYEKISSYEALREGAATLAIYPETRGVSSRWLRFAVNRVLPKAIETLEEYLPQDILDKYHLPGISSALIYIHTPQKLSDAEAARKRFSFEEVFFIQLAHMKERVKIDKEKSFSLSMPEGKLEEFLSTFPFKLTTAQRRATEEIKNDLAGDRPMSRLLEGDVGSGKTAVAVAASYIAITNGYQVAYMAPTEILANQHFQSFVNYFKELRLTTKVGLITSSECKKYPSKTSYEESTQISKTQLLKWVAGGEIPILIGTHALIQKNVVFKNLALAIIDEQHRFGTKQRAALVKKSRVFPHLLSMTATPIPRTLALTIYSDLDLSVLDELPKGRQKIITRVVPPSERAMAYEEIRREFMEGRQAFVVCPRIEVGNDKLKAGEVKNVKDEAKRLKKDVFPEYSIEILHGKMSAKEKEQVLRDFRGKRIDVLVATSVIEVGIDVPNATVIIIEGAERFGLAQLHQLRGRVMRSSHEPYCFVFSESSSEATIQRLRALVTSKNGFELAEYDLQIRGPGELAGLKQWGISDVGMEALKNIRMVEAAREESKRIIDSYVNLKNYPELLDIISTRHKDTHFE